MAEQNNRKGTVFLIAAMLVFAGQDGISGHLGRSYNVLSIVMLRYWIFVAFGIWLMHRAYGGIGPALATGLKTLQVARGLLLVAEICVMQLAFVKLGLIETHAVFSTSPLMVAALSGPVLGEKVGWRRWAAIGVGCLGVLVILKPGSGVFSLWSLVPLLGAFLYALYGLLTVMSAARIQPDQLLLDGSCRSDCTDPAGYLVLETDDASGFLLDGNPVQHRDFGPLLVDPLL
jgi:drug/metabolite transporter (DMT)-like permease